MFRFIGGSVRIDESLLVNSLWSNTSYSFDMQYRTFLTEKEEQRKTDSQISLIDDLIILALASGLHESLTFEAH